MIGGQSLGTVFWPSSPGHSEVYYSGDGDGEDEKVQGVVDEDLSYNRAVECVLKFSELRGVSAIVTFGPDTSRWQ